MAQHCKAQKKRVTDQRERKHAGDDSTRKGGVRILVQVAIYRRLLIGRDGHLDQSEIYDISTRIRANAQFDAKFPGPPMQENWFETYRFGLRVRICVHDGVFWKH